MRALCLALVLVMSACDSPVVMPPASTAPAAMPWLQGFAASAASEVATATAAQRLAAALRVSAEDDYGGFEVRADLGAGAPDATVLASYRLGIAVLDPRGQLRARAPGAEVAGSADELLALAVGDGQIGGPVIMSATQTGGHRESTTTITIYRLTGGRALGQLFSAPIEVHRGSETSAGSLTLVPAGLLYRAPDAPSAVRWTYDAARGRYVEPAPADRRATPGPRS